MPTVIACPGCGETLPDVVCPCPEPKPAWVLVEAETQAVRIDGDCAGCTPAEAREFEARFGELDEIDRKFRLENGRST